MCFIKVLRALCAVVFITCLQIYSFGCKNNDTSQAPTTPVSNKVLAVPTLLATLADSEKPDTPADDVKHSSTPSPEKPPAQFIMEVSNHGRGFAYIARVDDGVHVVHNSKVGKSYREIAATTLTLSPDGQRVAYCAKEADKWVIVDNDQEYGPFDDKGPPVFSPDSRHIAYEAKIGDYWYVYVDNKKSEWAVSYYDRPAFSNDSNRVLRIENTKDGAAYRLAVSDRTFKKQTARQVKSPELVISPDRSRIAAVDKSDNLMRVVDFTFNDPSKMQEGPLYKSISNISFSKDGSVLVYIAKKDGKTYLVMNGKEEQIPEGEYPWAPVVKPDSKGIGIIVVGLNGAYFHQAFSNNKTRENLYKECADLTFSNDGLSHAYVAIKDEKFLIVTNGKEGPTFDRVISPQFSPDGKFLVYRARQDGKRFVVVADATGRIIRQHPGYERVFETTFTEDGKSVAYGVKDGNQLWWKVEKL